MKHVLKGLTADRDSHAMSAFLVRAGRRVEIWCDPNEKMCIELFERL